MKMTAYRKWIAQVAVLISVCSPAVAADKHTVHSDTLHHPGGHATIPSHKQAYTLHSGVYDGRIDTNREPTSVFRGVVEVPNAPWLKLYFDACELGGRSYLKITSREDGAYQYLNSTSLKQWYNTSAFFNGNAVEIELFVAPEDKQIYFELTEVLVGGSTSSLAHEHESSQAKVFQQCIQWGICDEHDDRVSWNDDAIGRLIRVNASGTSLVGTAFITSNGTHICSGHNFPLPVGDVLMLEFNVPASDPDGTPNFADPSDQYAMDLASVDYENMGEGRDWAVFLCHANSNTNLLPVQAQNAFYRLSLDSTPATIRITGYGLDECPPGTGGNQRNSSSSTLQTATGMNINPSGGDYGSGNFVYWRYNTDLRVGNCGSPVIPDGTTLAVGLQNSTICPFLGSYSSGTSFDCNPLENAVNSFPGTNIIYADNGHPFATGAGTVFRPFSTVAGAVATVPAGGIVSIVQGSYNESMTISTAMRIVAPVGNVTIGPTPSPKIAEGESDPNKSNPRSKAAPVEYSLSQNYPNPFNPETTIEYTLPKPSFVVLKIFDILGQEVKTLVNEFQEQEAKSVTWDGKNNHGQLVPSGQYIYRLFANGHTQSAKSLLLK